MGIWIRALFCFLCAYGLVSGSRLEAEEGTTEVSIALPEAKTLILTIEPLGGSIDDRMLEKFKRDAPLIFNQYIRVFGFNLRSGARLEVRIYFNKDEYMLYKKRKNLPKAATGNFEPDGLINIEYQVSVDSAVTCFRHELSHFFEHEFMGKMPGYLSEAFADALGEYQVPEFGVRLKGSKLDDELRNKIVSGEQLDLRLSLGSSGHNQSYCSENGNIGFTVVTYLLSDDIKARILGEALLYMKSRRHALDDFVDGLDKYYPGGIDALQRDWEEWVVGYIDEIRGEG